MDFTPGESQQAVAGLAAEVLTAADPWKELARAGLLSLGVLDTTTLLTEIGRRAPELAMKALATVMTGAFPHRRWGSDQLKDELLPGVASGETDPDRRLRSARRPWPRRPPSSSFAGPLDGVALVDPLSADITLTRIPTSSGYPSFLVRLDRGRRIDMLGGPTAPATSST